ncbi:MAG TPA: glycoside hydrolase family 31 protein [Herpetosiphonaceae bacterium]|nr:glycoside hydrolase family 31 protein [Herpetosiphonaceae bacterium]
MYTLQADGSLVFHIGPRATLALQPYGLTYGVRQRPASVVSRENGVSWIVEGGQAIELDIGDDGADLLLMFHGKPGAMQIGVDIPLQSSGPWYGMGERVIQGWPLEQTGAVSSPFIPYDHAHDGTLNIGTPLWVGAAGVALLIEEDTGPLHVRLTPGPDSVLSLVQQAPPVPFGAGLDGEYERPTARLALRLIKAADIRAAAERAIALLGHPQAAPPLELLANPIWTTWARYKMGIDQEQTLAFAREIVDHGFPRSVMEIDDRWQTDYGDLEFDRAKFPDPRAMIGQLHALGFKVTLWVPPFFAPGGAAFAEAAARSFLVRHPMGGAPYPVRWWQGWGGLLDVSNPDALDWWRAGLLRLQSEYGVDGFKFDGAEGNFLPPEALTAAPLTPAEYADRYVAFVAADWRWTEVRTGWRSQRHGILFREWDKFSRWDLGNGLHSVITQALTLGIIGYPFVLTDMIGGNAYDGETPDRELLIRWTQATALLPAMQFSIPPWQYDEEASLICLRYARLHADLAPDLEAACAEACAAGAPLVRPLWWHFPDDAATFLINDQWLLGERWLAAPVVCAGQASRDIYLPAGEWRDHWSGQTLSGPLRLEAYPAPLQTLPLFERV